MDGNVKIASSPIFSERFSSVSSSSLNSQRQKEQILNLIVKKRSDLSTLLISSQSRRMKIFDESFRLFSPLLAFGKKIDRDCAISKVRN
jgi:hypothetical protein